MRHPWIQVRRKKGYIFKQWEVLHEQCPLCRGDAAAAERDTDTASNDEVAQQSEEVDDVSDNGSASGDGLGNFSPIADAGYEDELGREADALLQSHALEEAKVPEKELAQSSLEKNNNERVQALKDRVHQMMEKSLSPSDRRSLRRRVKGDIELARQYEAHWRNHAVVTTQAREDAVMQRMRRRVQRLKANKKQFDRDAMYAAAMGTASPART